jgi:hypothetical protein
MTTERGRDMGPGGFCVCPKCDERIRHNRGVPCQEEKCPRCGARMLREGSHHHELFEEKRRKKGKTSTSASD